MKRSSALERNIGYRFKRKQQLEQALTHPSYRHENAGVESDNQRLEFLGDAVLDLMAADYLFRSRNLDEGAMTKIRSGTTCTSTLARIARGIGLGEEIIFGKGEASTSGSERDSNLADALEAVIGAAYIDGGMKAAQKIFDRLFLPLVDSDGDTDAVNPKGALQEYCQKNGADPPIYKTIAESGPAHDKQFIVAVEMDGRQIAQASASRKSLAQQRAAAAALRQQKSTRNSHFAD